MERHDDPAARVRCVLLALTAVLLLAALGDGIRLDPGPVTRSTTLAVQGSTTEMTIAAPSPSSTQLQGRRSGGVDRDRGLPLREEEQVRATGSSLPDCSHACGACSPCSRVMVSFKCSTAEPLPCPMVYRCMCKGKCYPVPSS